MLDDYTKRNLVNDFHVHTIYSDGKWSVEQTFENMVKNGIKKFAFCDHNVIGAVEYARKYSFSQKYGIDFINAVEVYVWYGEYLFDVLYYGFNLSKVINCQAFTFENVQHINRGIMAELCDKGEKLGLHFDRELLFDSHNIGGRSTFYEELEKYKENFDFLSRLSKTQMIRDMTDKNPLSIDYKKHYMSLLELREICNKCGGILSLAHPFNRYTWKDQNQFVYDILDSKCIDAIECYHTSHTPREAGYLKQLANQNGLLITGGSDSHNSGTPFGTYNHGRTPIPELDFWQKLR